MKKESEKNMTHSHEDLVENKSFIMKKMTSKEYRDWQLLAASLRGNVKKVSQ
ncbi:hypothetical protein ABLU99_21530 [Klebsiella sp. JN_Kp123]|uniref:hypothetical protein n=1 Tax=Klebsiella sp. JN_Kp123 TaxID=3153436 RepID=UPI0032B32D53